MSDDGSVRDELVGLVFMALSVAVAVIVQRKAADPDVERRWRMRGAKAGERAAATAAARLWRVAERARLVYERESA